MQVVRKVVGRNQFYIDLDKPLPGGGHQRVPGVTTLIKNGKPAPGLMVWAGDATAEYAIDHWDELAELPIAERLKRIKGGRYEKRDTAADKGRLVHRLAERLTAGQEVPVPEGLDGYVAGCVAFLNQFDAHPFASEMTVYSETHYYSGTLDLGANVLIPDLPEFDYIPRDDDGRANGLFDWKTGASGIWGDVAYQLAGYRFAEWAIDGDSGEVIEVPDFDFAAGIHLRADGGYTVTPLECGKPEFQDFLTFKASAEALERTRELALEAIVPPLENRFRLERIVEDF